MVVPFTFIVFYSAVSGSASMTLHLSFAEYGVNSNTKTGKIVAINAFYLTLPVFSGKI